LRCVLAGFSGKNFSGIDSSITGPKSIGVPINNIQHAFEYFIVALNAKSL
jgi:hypothetical protein